MGSCFFDVGDMLRTGAPTLDENEVDLDKVNCDISNYRAIIDGYLDKMDSKLSTKERSLMLILMIFYRLHLSLRRGVWLRWKWECE